MSMTAIVDIVCAVFLCAFSVRIFLKKDERKNRWERIYCLLSVGMLVNDALAYSLTGPEYPAALRYVLTFLSMHGVGLIILVYIFYTESLIREKTEPDPRLFRVLKIAVLLWLAVSICESLFRHMITFTDGIMRLEYCFPAYVDIAELVLLFAVPVYAVTIRRKIGARLAALFSVFAFGPILATILFTFAGIDMSYPLGAFTFLLMDLLIQEQFAREADERLSAAYSHIEQQQEDLQDANARNDALYRMIDGCKWSYGISAAGEVVSAQYDEGVIRRTNAIDPEDPMAWVNVLHPDDRARVRAEFMAAVRDRSGNTPYETVYRMLSKEGTYIWARTSGRLLPHADATAELFGMSIDITAQMEEQQKRLLGAMPLSDDALAKANIGMWAFELDEGRPPRMYDDETMLGLVGLDHQVPPEEAYHAWYDHIDEGSYDLVNDAVARMMDGEHAEVQYPWHFPDGRTIMVRCGGVRNFEYTRGIRIEGTHQDVTQTLHFDEEERKRAAQAENDLIISKLRADSLAFIADNEPDLDAAINFFGKRILEISDCDQVIFRELDGHRIVLNAPGIQDIPQEICSRCPFSDLNSEFYAEDGTVLMNDCRKGCSGVMTSPSCPAKSSFMRQIFSGGELAGLFTIHYLNERHTFSGSEIEILKTVAIYLGLLIGRINEKKAKLAKTEAELSNKAKTDFLFSMSHDIRTPMNAIMGFTNMAIRHIDEKEKAIDCLEKTQKAGGMLLSLINSVLEMSRIESGNATLEKQQGDVYYSFANIENTMREMAESKDIELSFEFGNVRDRFVFADFNRCMRVFVNVISNAIKYTPEGGFVKVKCEQLGKAKDGIATYQYTISDNGIGMSEEYQKHIFEQFSREQTSTVSGIQGSGLGMSVVKSFLDLMGGTIDVYSKQGEGSTFTIVLPFQLQEKEEYTDPVTGDVITSLGPAAGKTEKLDCIGRSVLLVEDNELNREIAIEILEEEGLMVEDADDGTAAVEKLREKGPDFYDFILMDIQMPKMNGYEATKAIREMYPDRHIPIIALSANAFAEDKKKSFEAGMDDHVAKPINVRELFGALEKFLR